MTPGVITIYILMWLLSAYLMAMFEKKNPVINIHLMIFAGVAMVGPGDALYEVLQEPIPELIFIVLFALAFFFITYFIKGLFSRFVVYK